MSASSIPRRSYCNKFLTRAQERQCDYVSDQVAGLCLLYCLAMPKSNPDFFSMYVWLRAIQIVGFKPGQPCSQDVFERTLPRFNILSIRKMRRNKA